MSRPNPGGRRMARERATIRRMVEVYCQGLHTSQVVPCLDCEGLLEYSLERISNCPYASGKPVCTSCPIHCYARNMRDEIRQVMKYAGPRMLFRHPVLTIRHLLDRIFWRWNTCRSRAVK
jgi:hypothetical protein